MPILYDLFTRRSKKADLRGPKGYGNLDSRFINNC
jgi:hypothetical protein